MTRAIWKYELPNKVTTLRMPYDARVVAVREQRGVPCLWAMVGVSDDRADEERSFVVVATGEFFGDDQYVGSVHLHGGVIVLHVLETDASGRRWAR